MIQLRFLRCWMLWFETCFMFCMLSPVWGRFRNWRAWFATGQPKHQQDHHLHHAVWLINESKASWAESFKRMDICEISWEVLLLLFDDMLFCKTLENKSLFNLNCSMLVVCTATSRIKLRFPFSYDRGMLKIWKCLAFQPRKRFLCT